MFYKQNDHIVSFKNTEPYYFLEKSKKSTTLLVLAVYCLLYKHMQEYRHAGLISHSCAPISGGPEAGQQPPRHFRAGRRTVLHAFLQCFILQKMLLQLNCKLVYNIYKQTPYSKVYLTISRVYSTYSKEKLNLESAKINI